MAGELVILADLHMAHFVSPALPLRHEGAAFLMDSAWIVFISSFSASLIKRCLARSAFPSKHGAVTSTVNLLPQPSDASTTLCARLSFLSGAHRDCSNVPRP